MQQLKKLKKEMVPGPTVIKHKDKTPTLDWAGKGVGCHLTHKQSGLECFYEKFTNFKQNFAKAEKELEQKVAKWFEQQMALESERENTVLPLNAVEETEATHLGQEPL